MVLLDDRILEHLREAETSTATEMAEEGYINYSRQHVSNRLKKLSEYGLVKPLGNGVYMITERGEGYLDGKIDTTEGVPDEVESSSDSGPTADGSQEGV